MDFLIFYAIVLGILCSLGAGFVYVTEIRPMHRDNRKFGEMLQAKRRNHDFLNLP